MRSKFEVDFEKSKFGPQISIKADAVQKSARDRNGPVR